MSSLFTDVNTRLADMDRRGIDVSVLSLPPTLFLYWVDATENIHAMRWANDALAEMISQGRGRLAGLASLPMVDPRAAAEELHRAVTELGLRGALIGTQVEGHSLDEESFHPVWKAAADLGVPIVLHPYYLGHESGYERFYLTNLLVNPLQTALAAAQLILTGTLARFTETRFMLVHGGGFLPYQIGRIDHGWHVRPETRASLAGLPSEEFGRLYFDSVTHHDGALAWLVDLVGADKVVLGTDLPFDMADGEVLARVRRVVGGREAKLIEGENAMQLFGLNGVPVKTSAARSA
jgi:aminocarboxymuconate-semialdehyde decarboxylase